MHHRKHILVVEDEFLVRRMLRQNLEAAGYQVSEAHDRASLMECLHSTNHVDLITLDLSLGKEEGLELASAIRQQTNIPIIMLTARVAPRDRIEGLERGADDYIGKPFLIREVLLRIEAVLRRYTPGVKGQDPPTSLSVYRCGLGTADVGKRQFYSIKGHSVPLTDTEFELLIIFLRNPSRIMSRDDLCRALRGRPWDPMDRNLDGHVARLRRKIEQDPADPQFIKTVWNVGYVFAGEVEQAAPDGRAGGGERSSPVHPSGLYKNPQTDG